MTWVGPVAGWRWLRAHLGVILEVGLLLWTGYSVGWMHAMTQWTEQLAQWEAMHYEAATVVWINAQRDLVLRGDPNGVTRVAWAWENCGESLVRVRVTAPAAPAAWAWWSPLDWFLWAKGQAEVVRQNPAFVNEAAPLPTLP